MTPNLEQQIPFDSDFDGADHAELMAVPPSTSLGLSSGQAFIAGLISAVLVIGTIGFIILLVNLFYS